MSDSESSDGEMGNMFALPREFSPPPPEPTYEIFTRADKEKQPSEIKLRLVGSHPLWGHHLWNAAKVFANWMDSHPEYSNNKNVLELGAGAALPSFVAAINGASKVVITDYPDNDLISNIQFNAEQVVPQLTQDGVVIVQGYLWGSNTRPLLARLNPSTSETPEPRELYDTIILSDLLFNHSQHRSMLKTCKETLKPRTGRVFVFFTHHRPWLADADNKFFEIAAAPVIDPPAGDESSDDERDLGGFGFKVEKVLEEKMTPMFSEDPGSEEVRATIHGYIMWLE
ncbi:nicotinamide n-methyltransferase [Entomortierella chlamydospora]|uniref:Protein N-terminal and lysine N-methyltransferase EFM7 n=1 Tax=Entomortierella chlamydospora TaxID=101097 RepID=A0A9P6T5M8_9FUNG|nr:nicotinamide n-methyltransferase [Entomortierella chlamydospora]KAG0024572.1 nicotinamide n-methyltransferase [Entomortierella chlamydospora]